MGKSPRDGGIRRGGPRLISRREITALRSPLPQDSLSNFRVRESEYGVNDRLSAFSQPPPPPMQTQPKHGGLEAVTSTPPGKKSSSSERNPLGRYVLEGRDSNVSGFSRRILFWRAVPDPIRGWTGWGKSGWGWGGGGRAGNAFCQGTWAP